MCKVNLTSNKVKFDLELTPDPDKDKLFAHAQLTPQQDFIGCLLTGVITALPYFLEAFLACLGGGGGSWTYKPGDRQRCQ